MLLLLLLRFMCSGSSLTTQGQIEPGEGGGEEGGDRGWRFTHANNGYVHDRPYLLLSLPCCSRCCCLCIVCCCLQPPAEVVAVGRQRSISPAACTRTACQNVLPETTWSPSLLKDCANWMQLVCQSTHTYRTTQKPLLACACNSTTNRSEVPPPPTRTQYTPIEGCVAVSQALPQVVSLST